MDTGKKVMIVFTISLILLFLVVSCQASPAVEMQGSSDMVATEGVQIKMFVSSGWDSFSVRGDVRIMDAVNEFIIDKEVIEVRITRLPNGNIHQVFVFYKEGIGNKP